MEKKLYRSRNDAVFGGVCGGLAKYMGIDSGVVRVITVILFFMGTLGFWMYFVLSILIPKEPYAGYMDQYNAADVNGNYPGGYNARNMNGYPNPNGYPDPNGFANPNGYGAPYVSYPNGYPNPNGFVNGNGYWAPYGATPGYGMSNPHPMPGNPLMPGDPAASVNPAASINAASPAEPAAPPEPVSEKSDDLDEI